MGRTGRRRLRRRAISRADSTPNAMATLERWMGRLGWKNRSHLKLGHFETTGRGLMSTRNVFPGDRLIEIPRELLITCATAAKTVSPLPEGGEGKLKAQELLALFLAREKRKGERSAWKCYVNALPRDVPPLPWLCEEGEIDSFPPAFRTEVEKRRAVFANSWERVKGFVTLGEFTWAYAMVNTRAVYVNPDLITSGFGPVTSDEPSMALCPLLDMFNHAHGAATDAGLVCENNSWKYVLTTSDRFHKYEELFISYGAHDNVTLMCEYGFFARGNPLDTVSFTLEEILSAARDFPLERKQFDFVKNDRWTGDLHVSVSGGLSFNLKAVLFVVSNGGGGRSSDWSRVIFREGYAAADFRPMYNLAGELLRNKLGVFARTSGGVRPESSHLRNVLDYFEYRVDFVGKLSDVIAEKIKRLSDYNLVLFISSYTGPCWNRIVRYRIRY